jgi:hypothetical protein
VHRPSPFPPDSPTYSLSRKVLRRFRSWRRKVPLGSRRIPEDLWLEVTQLAASGKVHRVARWLGLDYRQLKQRVVTAFGPECPSLPGRRKKVMAGDVGEPAAEAAPKFTPELGRDSFPERSDQSSGKARVTTSRVPPRIGQRVAFEQTSPMDRGKVSVPRPIGGFIEVAVEASPPLLSPPLLAEVRSPTGSLLRLYSPDTGRIVQAFLQS